MTKEIVKKDKTQRDESSPDNALTVWLRLQKSLAEKNSIALCTLNQDGAVIGRIENDNSICKALRVSPDHSPLCAADCASAYDNAVDTGQRVEYTCHAGLRCFAIPVTISNKKLVILGGRAFTSTSEYTDFLQRYGDLDAVATGECLKNIEFLDSRELRESADLVDSTASYHFQGASKMAQGPEIAQASPDLMDAHLEIIRLTDQLESRNRSIRSVLRFSAQRSRIARFSEGLSRSPCEVQRDTQSRAQFAHDFERRI